MVTIIAGGVGKRESFIFNAYASYMQETFRIWRGGAEGIMNTLNNEEPSNIIKHCPLLS